MNVYGKIYIEGTNPVEQSDGTVKTVSVELQRTGCANDAAFDRQEDA